MSDRVRADGSITRLSFEDEPEEEIAVAEERAFTGTNQDRTSGKPGLIIQQTRVP